MRRWWRRLRYEIGDRAKQYPALYLPFARRYKRARYDRSDRAVNADTQIVIEAFPRSSNSFVREAFNFAQPEPVRLAHHLHAPAQVLRAARLGVPAMVIIRDPDDAVLSFIVRHEAYTLRQLLRSYRRFYRAIDPVRASFVLVTFETVTGDLGKAIAAVNARFGTSFALFEHTPENVERVFARMDQRFSRVFSSEPEEAAGVGRPTDFKQQRREQWQAELESPALAGVRREARELYERLVAGADCQP